MSLSGVVLDCPDPWQALGALLRGAPGLAAYPGRTRVGQARGPRGWRRALVPAGGPVRATDVARRAGQPADARPPGHPRRRPRRRGGRTRRPSALGSRRTSRRMTCGSTSTRWGTRSACSCTSAERAQPISASTSSLMSPLANTSCTSSESSSASMTRIILRAPSASSGTRRLGTHDASAES